jgi:hypothetical protein
MNADIYLKQFFARMRANDGISKEKKEYYPPPTIPSKGTSATPIKALSNAELYELMYAEEDAKILACLMKRNKK